MAFSVGRSLARIPRSLANLRGGRGIAVVALVGLAGCGELPEEQAGPQFPQSAQRSPESAPSEAIGMAGTPARDQAAALELSGVPYGQAYPEGLSGGGGGEGGGGDAEDGYGDTDPSALTDFHAALDPYGQWVDDPSYGTIWQPGEGVVGEDFAPYETAGHWSYGDDYVWVSDYSWGWAPFHYGRWVYATHGWGWIPGRQYAGAWTTWRTGYGPYSGYVGWAPLPPTYYWRNGVALGIGTVPPAAFGFCRTGNLFAPSLGGRMLGGGEVGAMGQYSRPFQSAVGVTGRAGVYAGGAGGFAGRTLAHPEVAGPSPASMHIASNQVTRPPTNNAGLARAGQFARPSTATALGGHAPAGWTGGAHGSSAGRASRPYGSSLGTSAYGSGYRSSGGETRTLGQTGESSFGGRSAFGGGRSFDGRSSFGHSYYRPSTTLHGGGGYAGHGGVHPGAAPAPTYHPPAYGGGYHPSGSGGSGGHGGGGVHGGGGGHGGGHR